MFIPGFGETLIPARVRVLVAIFLSLAIAPLLPISVQAGIEIPSLIKLLSTEVLVGLWIGLAARILLSALEFAGYQVGQVSGLTNAFGPSFGSFQGATVIATLLLVSAIAIIFIADIHHLFIEALLASYVVFPLGVVFVESMTEEIVKVGAFSLYIGATIAIPFFTMGVILNLGMGLANRMMPQLPVFFVAASGLIAFGLIILTMSSKSMVEFTIEQLVAWFSKFGI